MKPVVFNQKLDEITNLMQKELEAGYHKEFFLAQISLHFTSSYMYLRWSEEENKILICCLRKDHKNDSFAKIYDIVHEKNPIILGNIFIRGKKIEIDIHEFAEIKGFEQVRLRLLFQK